MKLKKHFDFRKAYVAVYIVALIVYFAIGLSPADAAEYAIHGHLSIPSIQLETDVTELELENRKLNTPENIAGSFKFTLGDTLIIGHASSVFYDLVEVRPGDVIVYNDATYTVKELEIVKKENVDMGEVLSLSPQETIRLMTCYGELYDNGDASERIIITASK